MIAVGLFALAVVGAFFHSLFTKERYGRLFLYYLILFNMGIMGILAAYAHIFMGPEIAKQIGWEPGSPFQIEIGIANLSYGVLGMLSFWIRGRFAAAAVIGWSVLLLGCFVGHVYNYITTQNASPLNIGVYIWFYDLVLPFLALALLFFFTRSSE